MKMLSQGFVHNLYSDPEIQELTEAIEFFKGMNEEVLQWIKKRFLTNYFRPRQLLMNERAWLGGVYFLRKGSVRTLTYDCKGKEITIDIIKEGSMFGEAEVISGSTCLATVVTVTDCMISSIPSDRFLNLFHLEPLARRRVCLSLANKAERLANKLQLREARAQLRVGHALLSLMPNQEHNEKSFVLPGVTVDLLSSMAVTTRKTTNDALLLFEKRGFIRQDCKGISISFVDQFEEYLIWSQ